MNSSFILAACAAAVAVMAFSGCATASKTQADPRCYELRVYHAEPGRLDDLHARFRQHTLRLFAKHGMENVGYWVPVNNEENKLVFLLAYPSREAREASWKAFLADPEWQAAFKQSESRGRLVAKAESTFLKLTDYSQSHRTGNISKGGVFELRTYTTPPGLLPNLDARFRNHTLGLFSKHGMTHWFYFHKTPDQPAADTTLIYFLAHASTNAAQASFGAFRKDPAWIAAREASEQKAGGSLTVKDGVKSEFLVATDYSPTH